MIYVIVKSEKNKTEIKNLLKNMKINERKIMYTLYPSKKRVKQHDIVICDYMDDKKKQIIGNATILMYKPTKTNKKNIENNPNIIICKNTDELEEKIDLTRRKNIYYERLQINALLLFFLSIVIISLIIIYVSNINYSADYEIEEPIDFKRENIVLYGDSITDFYDVKHYFGKLPVVNSGISGNGVDNLYNEINDRIYIYNPTKVFILIGTNDLASKDDTYIYNKIREIIKLININRPGAKIYLESIYPVNRNTDNDKVIAWMVADRTNERIKGLNRKLSTLCINENVDCEYINLYDELIDKNGDLELNYTSDGLHLSDEGYQVVTKELMNYIDPKLNKKVEKK